MWSFLEGRGKRVENSSSLKCFEAVCGSDSNIPNSGGKSRLGHFSTLYLLPSTLYPPKLSSPSKPLAA